MNIATPAARPLVVVLALCFVMNMLSRGFGETFGVFLLPLAGEFGWSRTALTGAYVVYMAGYGLTAPFAGQLYARLGPRFTFVLGLALLGAGYLLASRTHSAVLLYLGIGVLGALGAAAIGMVSTSSLIRQWSPARLATVLGLVQAGLGTGVLVFAPLAQLAIDAYGWRGAYVALGAGALALAPLVAALPWRRLDPGRRALSEATRVGEEPVWTLRRAVRTVPFWGLFAGFYFTSGGYFMVTPQLVAYLVEVGYTPLQAASAFGTSGLLSVSGMVGVAWASERFGRTRVVTLSFAASAAGMLVFLALAGGPSAPVLALALALFGITAGCRAPIISELAARLFGSRGYAAVLGGLNAGMGLGAGSGALLGAWLVDRTGDASWLFVGAAASLAVAASAFIGVRALRTGRW